MKIHEYQAKQIMKMYGISVPNGSPAFSPEEAARIAKDFDAPIAVVKAQIHAGGRGKAGGVKLAHNIDEVKYFASQILGKVLVTRRPARKERWSTVCWSKKAVILKKSIILASSSTGKLPMWS